ncbi:MAG: hypothetical protein HY764_01405 [Candidatus Portnoybacteria bacterium]|nr:hypothetical protein [Candidatus Portnoybacteria bacterium]
MQEGFGFKKNKLSGFTLIETLVGLFLVVIIFVGVFGMLRVSIQITAQSKARITATALANQKLELARNLTYINVGTIGGIPNGTIAEEEAIIRNGIVYTVKTTIVYIDDPFDNLSPSDPLATDYKRVKVKVSWAGSLAGEVSLQTDIAPKGVETTGGGGIISVLVINASGERVPQANVHIENASAIPPINVSYQTDSQGRLFLPGAPACDGCYKITVSKTDYSSDRTYEVGELVRGVALSEPSKPLLGVLENEMSEISFSIDHLADKTIQTQRYAEEMTWGDSFQDSSKISEISQLVASTTAESMSLDEQGGQYFSSGYLLSTEITPTGLAEWGRLNWNNIKPVSTNITYQLLYATNSTFALIPDADLTIGGVPNSTGFSERPLDISGLDIDEYTSLKIKANFSTSDSLAAPTLYDWQITWFSSVTSLPLPNLPFAMRGAKVLGLDASGDPIYKYEENLTTDASGQKIISNLEWDSYAIFVNSTTTGYDIADSFLPQPVSVNPSASQTTILKLAVREPCNLLVAVENAAGQPLVGASVKLYKIGYSKDKVTSDSGQAFFSPLTAASYNLEVKMAGFEDFFKEIGVFSPETESITLMPL